MSVTTLPKAPDSSPPKQQTSTLARLFVAITARSWTFSLLLTVALVVAIAIEEGALLAPGNWAALLGTLAPFVLVALASTPPILSGGGGVDISVGPTATVINCLYVEVLAKHGLDSPAAIPILLLIGAAVGLVNGVLIVYVRLQPVIATLAMFFVLSGIALEVAATPTVLSNDWSIHLANTVGAIPGGLITIAAAVLIWLVLARTRYVRTLYAVGGDDVACFSAGVNVRAVRIGAYVLAGVIAAIGGIALTAVIQTSQPALATTYSLIALAAVSLGGTSFSGGRGSLLGSFFGACSIFFLQELLSASGASTNWAQLVYGFLLIVGVILAGLLAKMHTKGRR